MDTDIVDVESQNPAGDAAVSVDPQMVPKAPAVTAPQTAEPAGAVESLTAGVEDAVENLEETAGSGIVDLLQRLGIAVAILAAGVFVIWLVWRLVKRLNAKIKTDLAPKVKPLSFKKVKLLSAKQIMDVIEFVLKIIKYVVTVLLFYITIAVMFSLFPQTQSLASNLFGYILTPLKNIGLGFISYIPNLFTIVVTLLVTRYVIRALKFFTIQIEKEKLVLRGFYPDWARPTFNILRALLYVFTLAIIYPLLPGSDSPVFQGISIFAGVLVSFGSTSAIGNLVAGVVMTYMRPFKIGDRIQIQNVTGFVVEKSLMVVRVKTHKNEYVTFPNTIILGSSIINYNTSSDEDEEGLVLYADITFGYSTPWQTVHRVLIDAALNTEYALKTPKPFVLQTAMDDFYCHYQINLYTKRADKTPAIYASLFEHIQNGFHAEHIDMTAAHYRINMPFTGPDGGAFALGAPPSLPAPVPRRGTSSLNSAPGATDRVKPEPQAAN
ncbi:MAG: mechanosensitive ion channel family protein [Treponema sp.]|jgi:small-conductance mechanosensitive channel|nr:mechanosensitive ion channel family protein [Treponema sp.]